MCDVTIVSVNFTMNISPDRDRDILWILPFNLRSMERRPVEYDWELKTIQPLVAMATLCRFVCILSLIGKTYHSHLHYLKIMAFSLKDNLFHSVRYSILQFQKALKSHMTWEENQESKYPFSKTKRGSIFCFSRGTIKLIWQYSTLDHTIQCQDHEKKTLFFKQKRSFSSWILYGNISLFSQYSILD